MKRLLLALSLCATMAAVGLAAAQEGHSDKADAKKPMEEAKAMTLTGEIVDTGCYLGHGAKGPDHASCAAKCIAGGMPMGLLTADNKLYLLTMSHENADPYNQAKEMAAKMVEITGPVHERSGMLAIEVDALKPVEAGKAGK